MTLQRYEAGAVLDVVPRAWLTGYCAVHPVNREHVGSPAAMREKQERRMRRALEQVSEYGTRGEDGVT